MEMTKYDLIFSPLSLSWPQIWNFKGIEIELWIIQVNTMIFLELLLEFKFLPIDFFGKSFFDNLSWDFIHTVDIYINFVSSCYSVGYFLDT